MSGYKAIVIGGTGAVGGNVVRELIYSPNCSSIALVGRRTVEPKMFQRANEPDSMLNKLTQYQINMEKIEEEVEKIIPDGTTIAFCTLGVGEPSKVSNEELWKVDVEWCTSFAKACKKKGVKHISLLGSVGAHKDSMFHILKCKGIVEQNFIDLKFDRTSLYRPSLLRTNEVRYGAIRGTFTQWFFPKLHFMLPTRYHGIWVEDLAKVMRMNSEVPPKEAEPTVEIFEIDKCFDFLANHK